MKTIGYYTGARDEMLYFIPDNARSFLDIGCGDGNFGECLKAISRHNIVWGSELSPDIARIASQKLDHVIVGDISNKVVEIPNNFFDCITFNDSLEHIVDPFSLLEKIKKKLSPKGVIVCSIPNIRYFKALQSLIFDKDWKYVEAGTFDRTHLRFFTHKSIIRMFKEQGYKIEIIQGIHKTKNKKIKRLNKLTLGWLEDTLYLQFALRAKPINDSAMD